MEASSNNRELENSVIINPIINENEIIISSEDIRKFCQETDLQAGVLRPDPTPASEFLEEMKTLEGCLSYSSMQVTLADSYTVIDSITDIVGDIVRAAIATQLKNMAAQGISKTATQLGDIVARGVSKSAISLLKPKLTKYLTPLKELTNTNFELNNNSFLIDDILKIIFTVTFDKRAEKIKEKVFSSSKGWNLNSTAQIISGGKIDINKIMRSKIEEAAKFLSVECLEQVKLATTFSLSTDLNLKERLENLKERLERLEKIKNYLSQTGIELNEKGEELSDHIIIAIEVIEHKMQTSSKEVNATDPLVAYNEVEDKEDSGFSSSAEENQGETNSLSNSSINILDNRNNIRENTQELNKAISDKLIEEEKGEDDKFFDTVSQLSSSSTEDEELFYDALEDLGSVSGSSAGISNMINSQEEVCIATKAMNSSRENSDPSLSVCNNVSFMRSSISLDNNSDSNSNNININEPAIFNTDANTNLDTEVPEDLANSASTSAASPLLNSTKNSGKQKGVIDRFSGWLNKGEKENLNKCHISIGTGIMTLMSGPMVLFAFTGIIVTIALRKRIFEASQNLAPSVITKVPGWAAAPVNFILNYPTTTICLATVLAAAMLLAIATVLIKRDEKNSEVRTKIDDPSVVSNSKTLIC